MATDVKRSSPDLPRDNLVRALQGGIEFRERAADGKGGLGVLCGTLAPFDVWTEVNSSYEGHFMECIRRGAFRKTFGENTQMKAMFEHGKDPQIGGKVLGPILLADEDDTHAFYEVDLLDTSYNRDLEPGLRAGLYGSSFRFRVLQEDVVMRPRASSYNPAGIPERAVKELHCFELGPCTWPQYPGAGTGMRSRTDEWIRARLNEQPSGAVSVYIDGALISGGTDAIAQEAAAALRSRRCSSETDEVAAIRDWVDSVGEGRSSLAESGLDARVLLDLSETTRAAGVPAVATWIRERAAMPVAPEGMDAYDDEDDIDQILCMISKGADFLDDEEDTDGQDAMRSILADLIALLTEEIAELPDDAPEPAAARSRGDEGVTRVADERGRERAYAQVTRSLTESPWLIHEASMLQILDIVAERQQGNQLTDEEIAERIGARARPEPVPPPKNVAVIPVAGPIVPHATLMSDVSGLASVDGVKAALNEALNDTTITAIVLDMDTPGGNADLIPELGALILAGRDVKPIYAVANTWAASAGYWLFSQATEGIVTPSGQVGSIGVVTAHQDISAMQEKAGIKTTLVTSGKYKAENGPFAPLSKEAEAEMQRKSDVIYARFVSAVAEGRGVSAATVLKDFGQGRMLMAEEAVAAGMADRIATLDEVLQELGGSPAASNGADPEEDGADVSHSDKATGAGARPHSETAATRQEKPGPGPTSAEPSRAHSDGGATGTSLRERKDDAMHQTVEELAARRDEIKSRLQTISVENTASVLETDLQAEWDDLLAECDAVDARIEAEATRLEQLARIANEKPGNVMGTQQTRRGVSGMTGVGRESKIPDNIWSLDEYRTASNRADEIPRLMRDGAMRAVELATFPHEAVRKEDAQEHVEKLFTRVDDRTGYLAQRILATGSPAYQRAFGKYISGRAQTMTPEESAALAVPDALERAMSTTGAAGGFAVPFALDPTLIPSYDVHIVPIRAVAKIVNIVGETWKGVTTGAVVASYDAEATEVSDDSPTLAQPSVTVDKAQVDIPFSIEIGMDWAGMQGEFAGLISESKDILEAEKFMSGAGHGSHEPKGLLVGAAASKHDTASSGAFGVADVYATKNNVGKRWRARGKWMGDASIYDLIRQFSPNAAGGNMWVQLGADRPATLIGYEALETTELDSTLVAHNVILAFGDFSQFVIVDRIGLNVEYIPHKFGTNGRPTGERQLYAYWRNSSDVLVPAAFALLTVKS